jgi:hypothetical protein
MTKRYGDVVFVLVMVLVLVLAFWVAVGSRSCVVLAKTAQVWRIVSSDPSGIPGLNLTIFERDGACFVVAAPAHAWSVLVDVNGHAHTELAGSVSIAPAPDTLCR